MITLKDFGVERSEQKLTNGAKVVLFKKKGSPILIRASFKAGASFDKKSKEGSAHFLEHLISNGRKNFPSKDLLAEYIESIGGTFSASTTNEFLSVDVQIADKTDISYAIKVLDSIIVKPEFSEADYEKERSVIISELKQFLGDKKKIAAQTVISKVFSHTAFEHPIIGTLDSLNAISFSDLLIARDSGLTTSNLTFTICGDISLSEICSHLDTLEIRQGKENSISTIDNLSELGQEHRISTHGDQNFIFIGYPGGQEYTKDSVCMKLIMQILAGGRNSRLVKLLRYEKGLIYGASPVRYNFSNQSVSGVMIPVSSEHTEQAFQIIKDSFVDLSLNYISEAELQFVKNKRMKSQKILMQTSQSWVDFHFRSEILDVSKNGNLDHFINMIDEITPNDISKAIQTYMSPMHQIVVVLSQK